MRNSGVVESCSLALTATREDVHSCGCRHWRLLTLLPVMMATPSYALKGDCAEEALEMLGSAWLSQVSWTKRTSTERLFMAFRSACCLCGRLIERAFNVATLRALV